MTHVVVLRCADCKKPVGYTDNRMVPVRCQSCKNKPDRGPTVGEVVGDAQGFREEIEGDAALRSRNE